MKRSLKGLVAAGAVVSVMAVTAPAAGAAEVAAADDCTTEYVKRLGTGSNDPLVEVGYTPPGTITVNADHAVTVVMQVTDATLEYVDCVV